MQPDGDHREQHPLAVLYQHVGPHQSDRDVEGSHRADRRVQTSKIIGECARFWALRNPFTVRKPDAAWASGSYPACS